MAKISEWQSAPSVFRIQNRNYVGDAFDYFYKAWKAFNGGYRKADLTVDQINIVDKSVRIPGKLTRASRGGVYTKSTGNGQYMSFMPGQQSLYYVSSLILEYTPRMHVRLTPVKDFLAKHITGNYEQLWVSSYQFFPNGGTGGMSYTLWDSSAPPDDLYVLEHYAIYTNKTDGTTQEEVDNSDDWNADDSQTLFDTFLPSIDTFDDEQAYIPYMTSLTPIEYNSMGFYYGNKIMGEAGAIGRYEGGAFYGINTIIGTGSGTFSENPGTPTSYYSGVPYLGESPKGPYICFKVADKKTWEKIFDGSGMPWSFNLADVVSPSDENLNKPTTPGQPTNPTGGGDGDGDNISDDIPLPSVKFFPNSNAYNRYWITPRQLVDVQKWIFSETFFNDIRRLWNDPAEYLINIAFYPFDGVFHDVANIQHDVMLSIGNLTSDISVSSMKDGYSAVFEGGSFDVKEYYGTYLDYAPFTSAEIYIPYIGYRSLNINDIMGKNLRLRYVVDFDTNILTATLLADDKPLTMYSGSFGVKLAISGTNANQVAETITKAALNTLLSAGSIAASAAAGDVGGAISGGVNTLSGVVNSSFDTQVSPRFFGNPTPSTGLYNTQIPHIIFHRPIKAEPKDYAALCGYSASYSGTVSSFSGFLKCSAVRLPADTTMSAAEQEEATRLLTGGIYL